MLSLLRTALAWIVAGPATILLALAAMVAATGPGGRRRALGVTAFWARVCVAAAGCRLRVAGLESVDREARYIVMVNHSSAFDIPVILAALPAVLELTVWAKRSLFTIPFLGWAMSRMGFVPVDRDDRASAGQMLRRSLDLVEGGRSVLVFPEETYGPGEALLPFRRGGFLLAMKSGLPILPVGIEGSWRVLPARGRRIQPGPVTVRVGAPIATRGLAVTDRARLMSETRETVARLAGQGACEPRGAEAREGQAQRGA